MFLTFQDQYTLAQTMSRDTDTATVLPFFKQMINQGKSVLEAELGANVIENSRPITTVDSTDSYQLPENCVRVKTAYVTIGTTRYIGEPVFDELVWQNLKRSTSTESDYLQKIFVRRDTFELYPTPAAGGYTLTLIYEQMSKDLSAADYTTGTITTLANAGTAVTGSSSVWTAAMVGRFFKVNSDNQWYEIATRTGNTAITLKKPYQGTAISAGTEAYTIGEMMRTPAGTHIIPVYYALWHYFATLKKDKNTAGMYRDMFEGNPPYTFTGLKWAKANFARKNSQNYIPSHRQLRQENYLRNPNFYPESIS